MSGGAFRKAGVWLGLVEEDDDRGYDDRNYRESSYRSRERERDRSDRYSSDRYSDEFAEDEDEEERAVPRARSDRRPSRADLDRPSRGDHDRSSRADLDRPSRGDLDRSSRADLDREESERLDRASVRSITRPSVAPEPSGALTYSTRDNLALKPQPAHPEPVRQRQVEEEQRYQITTLHPTTYREARTIGEHFRDGVPVIINLTEMDESDARRLVDFAAGLAFGLRGTIERVTNRVFLLSPANVQVTAEDKAKIAEGGFFTPS
ncbi:cell division protein SepF [Actinoplanes flavus]|uniref:Cell division protein SepF n=1 Tax=Actinoplanes flavus TaxID=2820290 RepID=A0ABS3UFI6_9ACTN|nr:cell division protein SepF [Actinoplanes flavus]MBO3737216.1 cell division protein SepF [Actinoplanes flavus]